MPNEHGHLPETRHVTLPVEESHFEDFIKGLLGRPQALIKRINGSFEIGRPQLTQIHGLLRQRILQQNSGRLVQFEARLGLSDDEIIVFNNLDELLAYNAPRRVTTSTLDLSWDFLVKFSDRPNPEKQRIQLKIVADPGASSDLDGDEDIIFLGPGRIHAFIAAKLLSFRIEYTARTWGEDIESMLSKYLHSITDKPRGASKALMLHSGKIVACVALLFYSSIVYGCFWATASFARYNMSRIEDSIRVVGVSDMEVLKQEISLLLALHAEGAWAGHIFKILVILVLSIPLTILLASWTAQVSYRPKPSFILITQEDESARVAALKKYQRRSLWYVISILVNILAGVIANLLFRAYF